MPAKTRTPLALVGSHGEREPRPAVDPEAERPLPSHASDDLDRGLVRLEAGFRDKRSGTSTAGEWPAAEEGSHAER